MTPLVARHNFLQDDRKLGRHPAARCADLTIAGEAATFRVPELLRGGPDPFIPPRLIARIGRERASDLMFTAREIDGTEAAWIGLVA